MASAAASPAAVDLLDPRDFATRDDLINFLMTVCGWSTAKVAAVFELSDRQPRRIASKMPPWRPASLGEAPTLTKGEAEMMLRDLAGDPYTSSDDRETAMSWVTSYAQATGIEQLHRIKFRDGIRPRPKPRAVRTGGASARARPRHARRTLTTGRAARRTCPRWACSPSALDRRG